MTKIGTRVFYTADADETERSRTFMGDAADQEFSITSWRHALAFLVLGDFGGYYRIRNVRIEDVLDGEAER